VVSEYAISLRLSSVKNCVQQLQEVVYSQLQHETRRRCPCLAVQLQAVPIFNLLHKGPERNLRGLQVCGERCGGASLREGSTGRETRTQRLPGGVSEKRIKQSIQPGALGYRWLFLSDGLWDRRTPVTAQPQHSVPLWRDSKKGSP
jgi:hypothetical protein